MSARSIQQLFDLSGKVALVTGGSRGLGLQMAHALGEAGARIMLSSARWLFSLSPATPCAISRCTSSSARSAMATKSSNALSALRIMWRAMNGAPSAAPCSGYLKQHSHSSTAQP